MPPPPKYGRPLRPIVSCIDSPSYKLSKFVNNILQNLTSFFPYNIKNSQEAVQKLKSINLPDNYILISLDVKSLFTNIPKKLVIETIEEWWPRISEFTTIDKKTFLEIIEFLFESSYFKFNNNTYKQLDGTPMGAPFSPIIAAMVMNKITQMVLEKIKFLIPFIFIFVDDTLLAVPSDMVQYILDLFNSIHASLQFTIEVEQNGRIPFLDLLVIREDNQIVTDIYKKPTSSNRILNYHSQHPKYQKINIIREMVKKVLLNSHQRFHKTNIQNLRSVLKKNDYPTKLINIIINDTKNNITRNHNSTNDNIVNYSKLPNIKGLSRPLKNALKTNQTSKKIALYNTKTIKGLFTKLKDKTPIMEQFNVVYKIPCNNCKLSYIGQTSQQLKKRVAQHEYDCRMSNVENPKTALAQHHATSGHHFSFNKTEILDREKKFYKRSFLEMTHIQKQRSVNFKTDTRSLSKIYYNIIRQD